eukprot:CAMPEP_0119135898 /NCGR_PEP_ID=MMETSP1310-20130426/20295_1 /TAXON_ID=464262 /ORGANISM="Genus nov. species nov., Strain RCC2339" /LENGTH=163 /DNA_ID=CAMNT_0007126843 /DNA_START=71 /DNA_END=559 /DNA_ORIENTATION=-
MEEKKIAEEYMKALDIVSNVQGRRASEESVTALEEALTTLHACYDSYADPSMKACVRDSIDYVEGHLNHMRRKLEQMKKEAPVESAAPSQVVSPQVMRGNAVSPLSPRTGPLEEEILSIHNLSVYQFVDEEPIPIFQTAQLALLKSNRIQGDGAEQTGSLHFL